MLENTSKKPCLVILELSSIDVNNTPKWNEEKLNVLYPYYNSEKYVRELLSDVVDSKELLMIKVSGLYRHNSNVLSYLKWMTNGFLQASFDGYVPLYKKWNESIKQEKVHEEITHKKKLEYIDKFIDLCKHEGINLVFAVSPNYKLLPKRQKWVDELEKIANRKDIAFYYHEKDSLFLSHREWFNEPFHLNDTGAKEYTRLMIPFLKENLN